jgi:hypothetical protein
VARYKVLKGVAFTIGQAFTSLMNYSNDDYTMGHILRLARLTGRDTLTIDFVKGEAGPAELLVDPISNVPANYTKWFWKMVEQHGSDRSLVRYATLTLRYDLTRQRPVVNFPQVSESPFVCDVRITDTRGKDFLAHFDGWWYPERVEYKPRPRWWKFWLPKQS